MREPQNIGIDTSRMVTMEPLLIGRGRVRILRAPVAMLSCDDLLSPRHQNVDDPGNG